jgi:hypothetical protein
LLGFARPRLTAGKDVFPPPPTLKITATTLKIFIIVSTLSVGKDATPKDFPISSGRLLSHINMGFVLLDEYFPLPTQAVTVSRLQPLRVFHNAFYVPASTKYRQMIKLKKTLDMELLFMIKVNTF